MDEIQFIRDCAARGLSKSHTAQLLGFWPASFIDHLGTLGLDDIEWCKPSDSLLAKQQRRDLHAARRGVKLILTEDERKVLQARALKASRSRNIPTYTAFGVTDTLSNLAKRFGVVNAVSVKNRINKMGMTLEQALTTPRTDRDFSRSKKTDHIWQKYSNAGYQNYIDKKAARASA